LASPVGGTLGTVQATGTIVGNEGPISVSVTDRWVQEGNTGSVSLVFSVTMSAAPTSGQAVSVSAATANGTASAPGDYSAVTATVTVQVIGDTSKEPIENYSVKLSTPSGGTLGDAIGIGKIADDD